MAATRDNFEALAAGQLLPWWDELVANGFHAVHLPEHLGGQGGRLMDSACVLEAAGKALLPGPLLPTVTAGAVALLADPTPAAESLLRDLASGLPAAVVLPDDGHFQARIDDKRMAGHRYVERHRGCVFGALLTVGARTPDGDVVRAPVDTGKPTAAVESVEGTDLVTNAGNLQLDEHHVADSGVLTGIDPDRAECVTVALVASTMAGMAQWCVEAVAAHLRIREQFGKVIGTFQALSATRRCCW